MTGRFKTMTMVDEAELERLKQRQIKEYNPVLKTLVDLQAKINTVFDDKTLSPEEKLAQLANLQSKYHSLFEKEKGTMDPPPMVAVPAVPLPPVAAAPILPPGPIAGPIAPNVLPPPQALVQAAQATGSTAATASTTGNQVGFEFMPFNAANLQGTYSRKYNAFVDFLKSKPDTIHANNNNELVVNGITVPNSSVDHLVRSMFMRNRNTNLTGEQEFLDALSSLRMNPKMISHKDAVNGLKHSNRAYLSSTPNRSSSISTTLPLLSTSGSSQSPSLNSRTSQKGTGKPPPGKRPHILTVFRL